MTTQHPEALRLAEELDDGYPLTGDAISAAAELRTQHARITELEAQLSAIGAGGVSPRMSGAAGAYQTALSIRTAQGWKLGGDKVPVLYTDEINGQQVCRDDVWLCTTDAFTHPSPTEGMVGGWMPIETAPKDGTEILLHAPACDYEGAYVQARTTYGRWRAPIDTPRIKYQDGFAPEPEWEDFEPFWASWDGGFTEEHPPTHWMPLPPPPTSFADSRKGE